MTEVSVVIPTNENKKTENKLGTQINADEKNQQTRLNENKSA